MTRSIEFLLGPSRSGEAFGRNFDGNRGRADHLATEQSSQIQIKRIVVIQGLPIDTQVSLRHTQIRTTFCPVAIRDIPTFWRIISRGLLLRKVTNTSVSCRLPLYVS